MVDKNKILLLQNCSQSNRGSTAQSAVDSSINIEDPTLLQEADDKPKPGVVRSGSKLFELIEINNAKSNVLEYADGLDKNLTILKIEHLKMKHNEQKCLDTFEKSRLWINKESDERISRIKATKTKLLNNIKAQEDKDLEKIRTRRNQIQEKEIETEHLLQKCTEKVEENSSEIVQFLTALTGCSKAQLPRSYCPTLTSLTLDDIQFQFDNDNNNKNVPSKQEVSDNESSDPIDDFESKIKSRKSFQVTYLAHRIIPISDSEAWVSQSFGCDMYLYNDKGIPQTPIHLDNTKHSIYSFTVTRSGQIFITDYQNHVVLRQVSQNDFDVFFDDAKYNPAGICTTKNDNIVVVLQRIDGPSKLRVFSKDGKTKRKIGTYMSFLLKTQSVFSCPDKVAQSSNEYFIVTEQIDKKVVAVDKDGSWKWEFPVVSEPENLLDSQQDTSIQLKDKSDYTNAFCPKDICCSESGSVIIADAGNNLLHIISQDGYLSKQLGLQWEGFPETRIVGIGISGKSKLWLTTSDSRIHIY